MADHTGQEHSDLNRLQQEAIRRAREMQARAQIPPSRAARAVQGGPARDSAPRPQVQSAPQAAAVPPPPPQQQPQQQPERAPFPAPRGQPAAPVSPPAESFFGNVSGSLDFLFQDSERSMLLILLLILIEEKADSSLIFAMMYLLI